MNSLYYVEDFIEFIAGFKDHKNISKDFWDRSPCPIKLARYDTNIVSSLAYQTSDQKRAYTDKQAELAKKLVIKYTKQLKKLPLPVFVPECLQFRMPIRVVDKTRRVWIENNKINLKFPFTADIIDELRLLGREGIGSAEFDRETKVWQLGLTEFMLNWAVAIGNAKEFEIDPSCRSLFEKLLALEATDYKIELDMVDGNLVVNNAASDLVAYVNQNLGGLSQDNLLTLCDMSSVLGYGINDKVKNLFLEKFNESWIKYIFPRSISINNRDDILDEIIEYARVTNRLPIHVYDTGTPKKDTDQIIYLNSKRKLSQFKTIREIKLMVTYSSVLIGPRKQSWLNRAEKVIVIK